jgi:hypothetical protein
LLSNTRGFARLYLEITREKCECYIRAEPIYKLPIGSRFPFHETEKEKEIVWSKTPEISRRNPSRLTADIKTESIKTHGRAHSILSEGKEVNGSLHASVLTWMRLSMRGKKVASKRPSILTRALARMWGAREMVTLLSGEVHLYSAVPWKMTTC